MLHDHHVALETAAAGIRRRLAAEHGPTRRADRLTPPEWPRSRGPTPNPRRH
jgi:hypothetical protein